MRFSFLLYSIQILFLLLPLKVSYGQSLPFANSGRVSIKTRPNAPLHLESSRFPVVVRFPETVKVEYAQKVLIHLEEAWHQEFDVMGFRCPLPDHGDGGDDRFDLYVTTDLDPGIGGYTSFSGFEDATSLADAYGYVVIANELQDRLIRGVIAHELFHASQMAYDWWEHLSFAEGSAVWIVQHVFPDEDIFWRYYKFFNAEPHRALDFVSLKAPFQYGTGMFYQFLDERFGINEGLSPGVFVRRVWQNTGQGGYANQPNFLQTINKELHGSANDFQALSAAWAEFGVWRLLVGRLSDGHHFPNAQRWEKTEPVFDTVVPSSDRGLSGVSRVPNEPLSHSYVLFERSDAGDENYQIAVGGSIGFKYAWRAVTFDEHGVRESKTQESEGEDLVTIDVDTTRASKIILVVSVLPGDEYNPEVSPKPSAHYHYEFR
jgi:hypothetical protein